MEHGNWNMVINKSTISMAIFNSYVTMLVSQRVSWNMVITIIISWNMIIHKSTISMVIFNSYVTMLVYQRVSWNMVI